LSSLREVTRELRVAIDELGREPSRRGAAGGEAVERLGSVGVAITSIGDWMEPGERLAVVRRTARTIRRLRLARLHAIASAWADLCSATDSLVGLRIPTVMEGGASRR
jgi:hypothetical protein